MTTEADTCRTYVVPKLDAAGWDTPPHSYTEQRTFTDGRIVLAGMWPINDIMEQGRKIAASHALAESWERAWRRQELTVGRVIVFRGCAW